MSDPNADPRLDYLRRRQASAFRQLLRALRGVSAAEAGVGARTDWPESEFGAGLDGSIAGIVHHLAAWKHSGATGLETGTFTSAFTLQPPGTDWDALREWLSVGQERLSAALRTPRDLDAVIGEWEGQTVTAAHVLTHLLEHDHYHAGQINLLRQLHELGAGRTEPGTPRTAG